jgi:hypothetical protein
METFVVVTTILLIAIGLWQARLMRLALPAGGTVAKRTWIHKYWPTVIMFVILPLNWIPYFLTPHCPLDVFLDYGKTLDRIYAIVKTPELVNKRPDRLMLVGMIADNSVDYKKDQRIVKSASFEIQDYTIRLEIVITPEVIATLNRPGTVMLYLLEVPKEFPLELVKDLDGAEKLGAKILTSRGFGMSAVAR